MRLALMASLAASMTALALSAPASAAPPIAAAGTFTQDSLDLTLVKQADGNQFFSAVGVASYTDSFTGTHVFTGTSEIFKDGSLDFDGTITFTGTVAGCGTGTLVATTNGAVDPEGNYLQNHIQVLPSHGTLPVHGSLELQGNVGSTLTYTGSYFC